MSEWSLLILIFWVFYGLNGFSWQRHLRFYLSALTGRPRAHGKQAGWGCFTPGPFSWRLKTEDVPFAFSAKGIVNLSVGASVRPPTPSNPCTLEWQEIEKVKLRSNKIWLNGQPFIPATGHITVPEIKRLARCSETERADLINEITDRWFRPNRLRRLLRVLALRFELVTSCNFTATAMLVALSIYNLAEGSQFVSSQLAEAISRTVPLALSLFGGLHIVACSAAWYQATKLNRWSKFSIGNVLVSPFLFPPQALQLRATIADSIWPATHPLTAALALGKAESRIEFAQNTWRDLCWPLSNTTKLGNVATAILDDHRARVRPIIATMLNDAEISPKSLTSAPLPDSPASCAFCPRCHDQFVRADGKCPHDITLQPLTKPSR